MLWSCIIRKIITIPDNRAMRSSSKVVNRKLGVDMWRTVMFAVHWQGKVCAEHQLEDDFSLPLDEKSC